MGKSIAQFLRFKLQTSAARDRLRDTGDMCTAIPLAPCPTLHCMSVSMTL